MVVAGGLQPPAADMGDCHGGPKLKYCYKQFISILGLDSPDSERSLSPAGLAVSFGEMRLRRVSIGERAPSEGGSASTLLAL